MIDNNKMYRQNELSSIDFWLYLHAYLSVRWHLVHLGMWASLKWKTFQFFSIIITWHFRLNRAFSKFSIKILGIYIVLYFWNEWWLYLLIQEFLPVNRCKPRVIFYVRHFLHSNLWVLLEQAGKQVFQVWCPIDRKIWLIIFYFIEELASIFVVERWKTVYEFVDYWS